MYRDKIIIFNKSEYNQLIKPVHLVILKCIWIDSQQLSNDAAPNFRTWLLLPYNIELQLYRTVTGCTVVNLFVHVKTYRCFYNSVLLWSLLTEHILALWVCTWFFGSWCVCCVSESPLLSAHRAVCQWWYSWCCCVLLACLKHFLGHIGALDWYKLHFTATGFKVWRTYPELSLILLIPISKKSSVYCQ